MWRPKYWGNSKTQWREDFESGADAILVALKEKSEETFIIDSSFPLEIYSVPSIKGQKGFAVFIPEED